MTRLRCTLIFAFMLFVAPYSFAEVKAGKSETDVPGCWCKYNPSNGQITPVPFIKVADKDYGDEEGNPEIWGYVVANVGKDEHKVYEDKMVRPVNIRADIFVPADGKAWDVTIGTRVKKYICKLWRRATGTDASR